jgi:hypothetical protein
MLRILCGGVAAMILMGGADSLAVTSGLASNASVVEGGAVKVQYVELGHDGASFDQARQKIVMSGTQPKSAVRLGMPVLDLGSSVAVEIVLRNESDRSIRVFAQLNDSFWVSGYESIAARGTGSVLIYVKRHRFEPPALSDIYKGMNGIPGGQMKLWAGAEINPADLHEITLYSFDQLRKPVVLSVEATRVIPVAPQGAVKPETNAPVVDLFGQYAGANWPGKIMSVSGLEQAAQREGKELGKAAARDGRWSRDIYGGWLNGPQLRASGHFRVEKVGKVWWLVDPLGRLFWSDGVTCVTLHMPTKVAERSALFQDPPQDGDYLRKNLKLKYGEDWQKKSAEITFRRLKSWGLNTIGPWSDPDLTRQQRMPYTVFLSSHSSDGRIDPNSSAWKAAFAENLRREKDQLDADPWCVGVFVDNEIHESFNPSWWEAYYSTVEQMVHEFLPHKLYLGSRLDFSSYPDVDQNRKRIVEIAARHTDVLSFNLYRFTLEDLVMPQGFDHPIFIGEFHFGALDRGMLHTGLRSVRSQAQRAEAYTHYMTGAISNPFIVGAHWFQFYDEPTAGRFDGENYQAGFLSITDSPYPETVNAVQAVSRDIYAIRSGQAKTGR